ncbi:MAG: hypothetical protein A3H91_05790 [Gammaproteobacteria bacterium RIFCSPLOWO2_02_FULL_61_13]|nr:MAG: hypothetical protein A3H91_05790 [Gammaproteobacteria bacterium RIFCSPLOWO2_02_FULL_61_13]
MPELDAMKKKNALRDRPIPPEKAGPLPRMVVQRGEDGKPHCHHAPLDAPNWLPAGQDTHMRPDDAVLGFIEDGQAYALPWWVMKNHHVANLSFETRPIMVVLCEACAGASAFDARVEGVRHTFRVEGKYNGTHILKDGESGSLWTPFDGKAAHGPRTGAQMTQLPLHQCTWDEWKRLNPQTLVPDGVGESRDGHGACFPNPGTIGPMPFAVVTALHLDYRLPHQSLVLGVMVDGIPMAYPLRRLKAHGPVLNERVGQRGIVIFSKAGSWLAMAYDRTVDGKVLNFSPKDGGTHATDQETGSQWDYHGRARSGPLQGRSLSFLPCGIEKWVGWATAHPDTGIFSPNQAGASD